jgi:hypothetical protein
MPRPPVGAVDAALDQPHGGERFDQQAGVRAIDPDAEAALVDTRLVSEVGEHGILQRRKAFAGKGLGKGADANLMKVAPSAALTR